MSYTKINNDIFDNEELKGNTKLTLLYLLRYNNKEKGYAYQSQSTLLKKIGLSKVTLLKCLNELEEKGFITRVKEKGGNNKYFIKTGTKNSTQQLRNTNNNKKEKTNIDEIILTYTNNELLIETIKDFIKMRKSIKKPLTERGLKGILRNLDGLSNNDLGKIEILENSIINSWVGVFEVKSSNAYKQNRYNKPSQSYSSGRERL